MVYIKNKSHYLGSLLLVALAAIGVGLLALHWQPAAAQAQGDDTTTENTQNGTDAPGENQDANQQESNTEANWYEFEETDESLILTVDTSSKETMLKLQQAVSDDEGDDQNGDDQNGDDQNGDDQNGDDQNGDDQNGDDQNGDDANANANAEEDQDATGLDLPRIEGKDGQPVWQYVGPASADTDLSCQSRSWSELGQPQTVAATLAEDNQADKPVKASLTVSLPSDASTDTRYCFRVPYTDAEGGENFYYISHQLTDAPEPGSDTEHFIFRQGNIQDDNHTREITVSLKDGDATGWQHAQADSADLCSEENVDTLTFEDGDKITVTSEDAGNIYCFRAVPADQADGAYVYEAYTVPAATVASTAAGDEEGSSSARLWIALAVVAGVGVAALVIYMLSKGRS